MKTEKPAKLPVHSRKSFEQLYPKGHQIKQGISRALDLSAAERVYKVCLLSERPAGAVPFSIPHIGWAARHADSVILDVKVS